jgi:hypothetical protein
LRAWFLDEKLVVTGVLNMRSSIASLASLIVTLAACSSDPLEPGAGDDPGTGTSTLDVEGRAHAEPRTASARAAADFTTEFSIRIGRGGQAVTTGTVTVSSRYGTTTLTYDSSDGSLGRWTGTANGYDEVYQLDVTSGSDEVRGVIVDGPDIHTITAPALGASLDSTVATMLTWKRGDTADDATLKTDELGRIAITDSGSYSMGPGTLKADKDDARANTIELRRENRVTPAGAIAGSSFVVTIEQRLEVLAQPDPAL